MAEAIRVQFNDSFYKKTDPKTYQAAVQETVGKLTLKAENLCKKEAPKKTGNLRGGHHSEIKGYTGYVKNPVHYWRWIVYGSGPHEITAKNANMLHWEDGSGDHFAKTVHHPGNKANNYPQRVAKSIISQRLAALYFHNAIKKMGAK
jgi:hypothetical protein